MSYKLFVFILLVILVALFAYFRLSAAGDPNSYFNQHTRFALGKYKILRWAFSLHNDGDARAEYLKGDNAIVIEVVEPDSIKIDPDALQTFTDKIKEYTGRETVVYQTDNIPAGTASEEDLNLFVSQHRRRANFGTTELLVIYTEDFNAPDNEVGRTYG